MNKAELLFNAYRNRSEIIPFPLAESEAKEVGKEFAKMLVNSEGLGGYKIAKSGIGVLTKPMITTSSDIELWFKSHKLEVEIIALVSNGTVEKTFLGLELPATRFTTWELPSYYAIADNVHAARLYVGPEIDPPYGSFKLYINDALVGEGEPKYKLEERVRKDMEGYVSLGVFIGPISIYKGDRVRVEGKKEINVKFV
ncbi:MAG: 2-keto-4-pentenoate hydratase [Saccharolobus sp.]|uniref:2-keto-4-pentenoate hydratase n=1 Tax=Saccharolobus TaxID=2100760 RepID=UPI001F0E5DD7|nr:2-keto-4-pentenoate hydratase [Saccharolobus shibatae]MCH4815772.1 2-keto-4-pentenoate hydratase [Saccharolobus shibatae]